MRITTYAIGLTLLASLLLHFGFSGIGCVGGQPTAVVAPGAPPGSYTITSGKESVTIPFEMFRGDIRMRAQINGRDCHFLVDNGSLWYDLFERLPDSASSTEILLSSFGFGRVIISPSFRLLCALSPLTSVKAAISSNSFFMGTPY